MIDDKNQKEEIKTFSRKDFGAALPKEFSSQARNEHRGKMRRKRTALQLIVFFGVLLVLSYLWAGVFLPLRAEKQVAASFKKGLEASSANAQIQAGAWQFFRGDLNSLSVELEFPEESPLVLRSLEAKWLNSPKILEEIKAGRGGMAENTPDELILIWDEAAFGSYLQNALLQYFAYEGQPTVEFSNDEIIIKGELELWGASRMISMTLLPKVIQGELGFSLKEIKADEESISSYIEGKLDDSLTLPLQLPKLGWKLNAESIQLKDGGLSLKAVGEGL